MFNKQISIHTFFSTIFMIAGALIFLTGVFSLFDNIVFSALGVFTATLVLIVVFIPFVFKKEKSDEMAIENFRKAQANTLTVTMIVMAAISLIVTIVDMFGYQLELKMDDVFPFFMGMIIFLTGFLFGKYERGEA